ncbi:MAG: hypothetical protein JWO35_399 [Candidatus Saccharibacteria bacterium]|nr:hypothetical protein [Candidatus Saccharibacteria bacterium]
MPPKTDNQDDSQERDHSQQQQGSIRVMMTIPAALLKTTDDLAKADYMTRSDVVRTALTEYVRRTDNLEKLATPITGQDVVLQRFLDEYRKDHPDSR